MTYLNQPLTPPDGCDACESSYCVCDTWGDEIDRAYDEWRARDDRI